MMKKLQEKREAFESGEISFENFNQSAQSYLGILRHCKGYEFSNIINNNFLSGFLRLRE